MSVYQKFIESAAGKQYQEFFIDQHQQQQHQFKILSLTPINRRQQQQQIRNRQLNTYNETNFIVSGRSNLFLSPEEKKPKSNLFSSLFREAQPDLLCWIRDIRFEPEHEPVSCMEATTLTADKDCARAMSIRYSQVTIQELRLEHNQMLSFIDVFIDSLPIDDEMLSNYYTEFSQFSVKLVDEITSKTIHSKRNSSTIIAMNNNQNNPFKITFSTPRKSLAVTNTLKPLERLALQIRSLCNNYLKQLCEYMNNNNAALKHENGYLESELRTLKDLYEKFMEILIGAELLNIAEILFYNSTSTITRPKSTSLSHLIRPFESTYQQLPLKWALIALWQLTIEDALICRILSENFPKTNAKNNKRAVVRRLDFSTTNPGQQDVSNQATITRPPELIPDDEPPEISVIKVLIDLVINQPNKHERLDVLDFIDLKKQSNKLIDLDENIEKQQEIKVSIYTSNQYKVAALKILLHLCVNDQAVRLILKSFATPNNNYGQLQNLPINENKIIKSIFGCYSTLQEFVSQQEEVIIPNLYEDDDDVEEEKGDGDDAIIKEAIKLIIQLTNLFHSSDQGLEYYNLIGKLSIEHIVRYLTVMIKLTGNFDLLHLSLTALANISFVVTKPFKLFDTIEVILKLFSYHPTSSRSKSNDLLLRDQAITILTNVATRFPLDIITKGGLTFVLSCLENCPESMINYSQNNLINEEKRIYDGDNFSNILHCTCNRKSFSSQLSNQCSNNLSKTHIAAIERIQQKATIALARMSIDSNITKLILETGVLKTLIGLCKFSYRRNHSDIVLIAGLTALRRMAKHLNLEAFKYYNALDLIELELDKLLDIYGTLAT